MSRARSRRSELARFAVPEPPDGLRERVLGRARGVLATAAVEEPWAVLWSNRWLRWAWSVAVAALLVGHWIASRQLAQPSESLRSRAFGWSALGAVDPEAAAFVPPLRFDRVERGISPVESTESAAGEAERSGASPRAERASAS